MYADPSGMGIIDFMDIVWNNLIVTCVVIYVLATSLKQSSALEEPVVQDTAVAIAATPIMASLGTAGAAGLSLSWNPVGWIIVAGVATAAVGVGVYYGIDAYQTAQVNKQKTVEEILKSKKGDIKRAKLDPGSPSWDDILKLTLAEIQERAKK